MTATKTTNLISQIEAQLKLISIQLENITITQIDKNTAWAVGYRFSTFEQKFTVALTSTGKVKKGSVRFTT